MLDGTITLTDRDRERLVEMADQVRSQFRLDATNCLEMFHRELERAKIIPAEKTPSNIVTMNSRVRFMDVDTGETHTYTVTWPHLASPDKRKISVLAPIGMALLGTRVGQIVEWEAPSGKRRFKVVKILYQPESKGIYDT